MIGKTDLLHSSTPLRMKGDVRVGEDEERKEGERAGREKEREREKE